MLSRPLQHLRQNLIAYLALFVALGGTSYAALTISGSQIRNRTIGSIKLDPHSIAGSIKAWVNLQESGSGKIFARSSSTSVRILTLTNGEAVFWKHLRFSASCVPLVAAQAGGDSGLASAVTADFTRSNNELSIFGHAPDGSPHPVPAYAAMVCP